MNTINQSITIPLDLPWEELLSLSQKGNTAQFKALLTKLIANLDHIISYQLSTIMQHKYFKQLEASWFDLQLLTEKQVSPRRVKVKVLDLSWSMVSDDLNYSFDIKHTALFKKLYSNEFDTAGGTPFGLLVIDHKITSDYGEDEAHDDLYTLQLLSELAEKSLCPVILGVDEFFFGDDPNRQLHDNARAKRILESCDFLSWQLLRDKSSSRFLHLALPEYLQRCPYQNYAAGFIFTESNERDYALWGNSAYLLAGNVIQEFERISWFGFLRLYNETGTYGAIIQHDLPLIAKVDIYNEDDGFWAEEGFVPLSSLYLSEQKGFFSNQSVWKAPTEELRMLGMLQTNLMACRFGHYIKVQIRDQIGRYDSMEDCKRGLENWLKRYISEVDYGEDSVMARYPLKACEVRMQEDSQDSTRYLCEIMLQPQYQYEMMDAQVLLTTSMSDQEVGESA
ncbi:type VI secretion system contractile sheath domain-containing protein [Aliivibrio logei]|uniref:type VI secretion system contractile sheath domain-containing protein n=1 Tax=Aliivibrio logei TaxID=688 RepID=UPI0035C8B432